LFAPRIHIVVLRAHPYCGESHNQRNATREVATELCIMQTIVQISWKCFSYLVL